MQFLIVGGSGIQGRAIAKYLHDTTDEKIIVQDPRLFPELPGVSTSNRFEQRHYLLLDDKIDGDLEDVIVISCLPTEHNERLLRCCIEDKQVLHKKCVGFVDLGGVTKVTQRQLALNENAKNCGFVAVVEAGIAPGIISPMTKEISQEEGVIGLRWYCGGMPKYPVKPHYHAKTFHTEGMIKEYSGLAVEREDGNVCKKATLTGHETIFVPGLGLLEARRTSGGLSTTPFHVDIPSLSYKTLRFPGHWDFVQKHVMTQKEPGYVLDGVMPETNRDNPDILVLCAHIDYDDGEEVVERYYFEYDYENDIPAMAQATGYVVGAVALMISEGLVTPGVHPMHDLDIEVLGAKARLNNACFSDQPTIYEPEEDE